MAIRVALHHKTTYRYDRLVDLSPHVVRLRPAPHCRTPILSYSLTVYPETHFLNWQQDPQSNYLARLVFPEPARMLQVEVDLVANMVVINPFDFFLEPSAHEYPFGYEPELAHELQPYLETEPVGPRLQTLLTSIDRTPQTTVDFLVAINQLLHREVDYIVRMEPGIQTCEETLTLGRGSCRDSAWLLVQLLRHLGLAARFVSGYLIQLAADEKPIEGPTGPENDFTDLHAWAEVYLPGAGWVGLDPTSGLFAGEGHIPLACSPHASSASPITGTMSPAEVDFDFTMSVTRVYEEPRVTKPYTEAQWQAIDALGEQVETDLEASDVRLTMGGEPTFVSIDDMEGAEWTTEAVGETKRHLSGALLKRLKARFAPGGMLHYGQGKWYPGESLPRWALACYWRTDGVPIWRDERWLADESANGDRTVADAHVFLEALGKRLQVDTQYMMPAYEDVWTLLSQERHLPLNVTPEASQLDDPEARARLARAFERGLGDIVGYVLPLDCRRFSPPRWVTGPWPFRSGKLLLQPGDSPIGLRLPLDALPWIEPAQYPHLTVPDPFTPRAPLPGSAQGAQSYHRPSMMTTPSGQPVTEQRLGVLATAASEPAAAVMQPDHHPNGAAAASRNRLPGRVADDVRTALCVEPREGHLYIFLPPTRELEDYLDLVADIEATAEALDMPVILEGYPPMVDHRIQQIKVTPDPGVIEVNIHPSHSWRELVDTVTGIYDDARQTRLGAEKFMLDGKHTGTGGGNHFTLGGPTPADSPLLRRPDLLRSLVAYWNNHPSLSYLFSGLFIGPTSQAPRLDEGRHDSLYELDIAFRQIPDDGPCPPWLVDRLFRHLLVDMTGNTHRAEFCIDKLYAPENSGGRLGLLELRAFEMPPHPRMSLVQQLLVRALIARFWQRPYTQPLVPWGTSLHDRFMLPYYVETDFQHVLEELREAGYPFQPEWFAPHIEFRFPRYGHVTHTGITLELRSAIEPWHVLGEEPGAGGTVRFVDSSVERLQVRVSGAVDGRHIVACQGRRLPLQPTANAHEFVAGVRYRAWQPPSCLHPTIPVHAPLTFDIIDTWSERAIGGCTYHVAHPGGRNFETFPVNAFEAESRRAARFEPLGHSPGSVQPPPEEHNPQFPCTLDLRR